jgi:hypothetical protein
VAVGATYTPTDFLGTGDLVGGKIVSTPWGREIDFVLSGAGTNQVDIYGRDYLGQPVHKTLLAMVPRGCPRVWLSSGSTGSSWLLVGVDDLSGVHQRLGP